MVDAHVPWAYNQSIYRVIRGEMALELSLVPSSHDVRIVVQYRGEPIYELITQTVLDVDYRRDTLGEHIDIILDDNHAIDVQVKPRIRLTHSN